MAIEIKDIEVLRAEDEWQRAGAYSVRIQGMNRQYHISLRNIISRLEMSLMNMTVTVQDI